MRVKLLHNGVLAMGVVLTVFQTAAVLKFLLAKFTASYQVFQNFRGDYIFGF